MQLTPALDSCAYREVSRNLQFANSCFRTTVAAVSPSLSLPSPKILKRGERSIRLAYAAPGVSAGTAARAALNCEEGSGSELGKGGRDGRGIRGEIGDGSPSFDVRGD